MGAPCCGKELVQQEGAPTERRPYMCSVEFVCSIEFAAAPVGEDFACSVVTGRAHHAASRVSS